jgi:hypothetical protein
MQAPMAFAFGKKDEKKDESMLSKTGTAIATPFKAVGNFIASPFQSKDEKK